MSVTLGATTALPFNTELLDQLMDEAGLDVLVVTSKHNVHYLLGGYRFFFFDYMDAIGESRYLPILVLQRGRPDHAAYFGNRLERSEQELGKFWPGRVETASWTSTAAMQSAVDHLKAIAGPTRRIGVESAFLPWDAYVVLRDGMEGHDIADARFPLERLRAVKSATELDLLRSASDKVVQSMLAAFGACRPGMTKLELADRLRLEEVSRGLTFEYCLVTAGRALNRSPSGQVIAAGDILSLDSGGNYRGYIGDLCRMAILGEPDAELTDLLGEVRAVQAAARAEVRPGACGRDIYAAAHAVTSRSPYRAQLDFLAHGMGLVSHEAPQLTSTGFVPYAGYDEDRGLHAGMVISIETALPHPVRGFIKLEDTVAVTAAGCEGFGDEGRAWTPAGRALQP